MEKKDPASKHDYAVALEDMEKKFTPDDVFEVGDSSARLDRISSCTCCAHVTP